MTALHRRLSRLSAKRRVVAAVVAALVVTAGTCVALALTDRPDAATPSVAADIGGLGAGLGRDERGPGSDWPSTVGPVLPESVPVSVAIPAIDVSSPIQLLGQHADGTLEVPAPGPLYDDAGWYKYSPTPGELGPAVLVGHIDSAANGPSVFFRLAALRRGETIEVTRTDGSVAIFVVNEVSTFRKAEFPTDLVYGNTNHAALRLISCGGLFDSDTGHYRDNIVVFASLVGAKG